MAEWARIAQTTIRDYIRGEEDAVLRNRKILAAAEKRGRIKYNASGDGFEWKVRYRRANMTTNNGEQTIEFDRVNRHVSANLDYEGYIVKDSYTKREKLKNRSNAAIVKVISQAAELLMADIRDQFAEEIYVDSSASGNSARWTGLESMFALNGTTTVTSGAQRAANAADVAGYPNDTYAGISTAFNSQGGATWDTQSDINSTWPFGAGDAHYDFWSPVVVNYSSTAWTPTATTWAACCVEATRFGIEAVNSRNLAEDGQIDMVLLDRGLFRQYKDTLDSKERITIDSGLELRSLGFRDTIQQDGVDISSEYGVPAGVGYGFNMNSFTLCSMQDQIFVAEGPYYAEEARSWRLVVDVLGQFMFKSPRNFFKLASLA